MALWDNAPLTRAALATPPQGGPRPIEREWMQAAREDGDFVVYWSGAWKRGDTHVGWGWIWWSVDADQEYLPQPIHMKQTPASSVERLLLPLAHEARVRIMQAMFDGPKSPEQLSEATGLKGGSLHEHLNDLVDATYVSKKQGRYDLTSLGGQLLVTVCMIAHEVVKD